MLKLLLYCFFLFQYTAVHIFCVDQSANNYIYMYKISTAMSREGLLIKNDGIIQMPLPGVFKLENIYRAAFWP